MNIQERRKWLQHLNEMLFESGTSEGVKKSWLVRKGQVTTFYHGSYVNKDVLRSIKKRGLIAGGGTSRQTFDTPASKHSGRIFLTPAYREAFYWGRSCSSDAENKKSCNLSNFSSSPDKIESR